MIEITAFTKAGGPLTKQISLDAKGKVVSDGSACVMSRGEARRVSIDTMAAFADLIGGLTQVEAIALGRLKPDLPEFVTVTTRGNLNGAADTIARTTEFLSYAPGQPALLLIDHDSKGMPDQVRARLQSLLGVVTAMASVVPAFGSCACVVRRSTSAGLSREDTGVQLPGSGGMHVYVPVVDGADIERALRTIHDRCWLAGLGWYVVGAAGQLLERSIVDRMVYGAERLVFEGPPILTPPVVQDLASRKPRVREGKPIDTVAEIPDLTEVDAFRLTQLKTAAAAALKPDRERARRSFVITRTKALIKRGVAPDVARRTVERLVTGGTLLPDMDLAFDAAELAGATVGDVLADPDRFVGATLADPLEGIAYGRGKAKVMQRDDGSLWIHSFAHGRTVYELKFADDDDILAWPAPVDIFADRADGAPVLTAEHVPDALWPFVKDTAERLGVATSSVALGALVACASVISEDWKVQPKQYDYTWTEEARLWGGIIGPPSTLKTPVINAVTAPVVRLEIAARERWQEEMRGYRAAMTKWKADGKPDPEPSRPLRDRYLVEDTSIEALSEVLRDDDAARFRAPQGKVLVRRDELAEFLASMDRYATSRADRGSYLRLYNGGPHSIDRITRGSFFLPSWSGCILGGIQPEPIQRIAADAIDDGLIQRFMFDVPGPSAAGADRAPDAIGLETYRTLFPALAALQPGWSDRKVDAMDRVCLHAQAHPIRNDIQALAKTLASMPDASLRLAATFEKWHGLFARLCLTFHLVEIAAARAHGDLGPPTAVISVEIVTRVAAYMRQVLAPNLLRAEAVMFASRQSGHAAWIAGYILAGTLAHITTRDIVRSYRALRAPEQREALDSTMEALCRVGWLEAEVNVRSGNRAPTAWRVNPRVHTDFAARATAEREHRAQVRADIVDTAARRRKGTTP